MSELPVNESAVLTGLVSSVSRNESAGKVSHIVAIRYLNSRGKSTVEASREFWVGDFHTNVCEQLQEGMRISVEFNLTSNNKNGKLWPKDEVQKIRLHELPAQKPSTASDKLNFSKQSEVSDDSSIPF